MIGAAVAETTHDDRELALPVPLPETADEFTTGVEMIKTDKPAKRFFANLANL